MSTFEAIGRYTIRTDPSVFPISTDAMLLGDFIRVASDTEICDLGCGCGILEVLLCSRNRNCHITGIDLQEAACALAAENILRNGLSDRVDILQGDLRGIRHLLPANRFSHVIANPPYFPSSLPAAPAPGRAAARSEIGCTLEELCAAAGWLLSYGGRFSVVYRPERLCDLFCALRAEKFEPKRLRLVRHRPDSDVCLVLLEAKYGGKPGLEIAQDLILHGHDGHPTESYHRIYQQEGAL